MGRHPTRYPAEVRERVVRLVFEHRGKYGSQGEAKCSNTSKFGCMGDTWRCWVRQAKRDSGARPGMTSDDRERVSDTLALMFDAHHLQPLAVGIRESRVDDLVVLCPTCHRWAHAKAEDKLCRF